MLAYDTETTGLDLMRGAEMFAFSVANPSLQTNVYRLDGSAVRRVQSQGFLERIWSDRCRTFPKVMHNAKFDLRATEKRLGRKLAEQHVFHDTMLQSHILQNLHPSQGLKDLAYELGDIPKDDEDAVRNLVPEGGNYQMVPEEIMNQYQARDAERAMLLHLFFYPKIARNPPLLRDYQEEIDLVRTTLRMEERGVMLHLHNLQRLREKLETDVERVLSELEALCGERLNPNIPDRVEWLLFDRFGLPCTVYTEKAQKRSTAKEVLLELRTTHPHPAIELLLQYRSWSRGIVTLTKYLDLADGDGVIHPNIRTCSAKTGRESCSSPNLQNVSKAEVRLNPYTVPARQVFRPRPGFVNFHVDYAGIEMRLLVEYTREELLVRVLTEGTQENRKYYGDVHLPAMETFYGDIWQRKDDPRWKQFRDAAKNANFATPYGAGGDKVAQTLGLPLTDGMLRFALYRERFPRLCGFTREIVRLVMEQGFVETRLGRILHVPRSVAYAGTNYLIQGTAAQIIKRAQNRVRKLFAEETGGEVQLLLPIHDELVFEFPRRRLGEAPYLLQKVREVMIDFPEFTVPLEIDVEVTSTHWGETRKYQYKTAV